MKENKSCLEGKISPLCFSILSEEEWTEISKGQRLMNFSKGEHLSRQGAFTAHILFIINGYVRVFIQSETARPFNIRVSQSGEFIGLQALLGTREFNTSAVALTETEACLIEIDTLKNLVEKNNTFALRLMKRHLETENEFINVVSRLHYKQMHGKLAETLLYLTSQPFHQNPVIPLLSRQDLADFAGISQINVVKILKQFELEKIISLDKKRIEIINQDALIQIGKNG